MSAGTGARPKKRRLGLRLFLSLLVLCWCVLPPSVSGPAGLVYASGIPASNGHDALKPAHTGAPLLADTLGSDILPAALAARPLPARGEQKASGSDPRPVVAVAADSVGQGNIVPTVSAWPAASAPIVDPGLLEGCRIPTGPPPPIAI